MEFTALHNGVKMPREGFGVFQMRDKEECKQSVLTAIRSGYRLIDTAVKHSDPDFVRMCVTRKIHD